MTKLPPGFTHELPQHLQQKDHGTHDDVKGVPVLDFDKFCCGRCIASVEEWALIVAAGAHGFSALIVRKLPAFLNEP